MSDIFTFEFEGAHFQAEIAHDAFMGAPWDEHDGHGIVSEWTDRPKEAGELVLVTDGRRSRYYDFAASCARALAEGWDAKPYNTGQETKRQQAAKAARADYEHLRAWCADEWQWVGVIVTPLCDCCGTPDDSRAESLWGIESGDSAYLEEVARELAGQVAPKELAA